MSAETAVAKLRERAYDALLADCSMAWRDSIELLEAARRAEIHGFVQKPVSAEKLKAVLDGL
ncbi:MAG: hypothetical protein QOE90_294 [Thermoplasmata archaeon]|jgi:CheY-like chemotaxis protein|nr:hypothetical protein [Thermoplasmata archaeon]